MIANRWNPLGRKLAYDAKSYIQDGLIAHWDAIENLSYGKGDPSSKMWNDLCGNYATLELRGDSYFTPDAFVTSGATNSIALGAPAIEPENIITMEAKIKIKEDAVPWFAVSLVNTTSSSYRRGVIALSRASGIIFHAIDGYPKALLANCLEERTTLSVVYSEVASYSIYDVYQNGEIAETKTGYGHRNPQGTGVAFGGTTWNYNCPIELCNVRVYNRALTAEEIAHNYAIDKERFGI